MEGNSLNLAMHESVNDSMLEETIHDNQPFLKEFLLSFTRFKKWYENVCDVLKNVVS